MLEACKAILEHPPAPHEGEAMSRLITVFAVACGAVVVGVAAQQPDDKSFPPPYFAVKIVKVTSSTKGSVSGIEKLRVKLNKKIPADTGRIEISLNSGKDAKPVVFDIADYQPDRTKRLSESDTIIVYFDGEKAAKGDIKTVDGLKEMMKSSPVAAKVFLRAHRPE